MKKILALILVLSLVLILLGCGQQEQKSSEAEQTADSTVATTVDTMAVDTTQSVPPDCTK